VGNGRIDWLAAVGAGGVGLALMGNGLMNPKVDVTLAVLCTIFGSFILIPVVRDLWRFVRPLDRPEMVVVFPFGPDDRLLTAARPAFIVVQPEWRPRVPRIDADFRLGGAGAWCWRR